MNTPTQQQNAWAVADARKRLSAVADAIRTATQFIEAHAEQGGYGYHRPKNPHDFCPDAECCTEEEIANHKAACEAFDRGEYKQERCGGWSEDGSVHVLSAPWGIGSYTVRDEWAEEAIAKLGRVESIANELANAGEHLINHVVETRGVTCMDRMDAAIRAAKGIA